MSQAVFAWEGFSFTHPDDWAPVTLTGAREEGYVRLQGSGRIGCQVRWKTVKRKPDLGQALDGYFKLLERDAAKARAPLSTEREEREDGLYYRWQGSGQGRGALLHSPCGRLFFIEVVGGRQDSLLPHKRAVLDAFRMESEDDLELWSLFGLHVRVPKGMTPAGKTLQSGRTWLLFRPKGAVVEVGRYAFGKELTEKHGLENWAIASLKMPGAVVSSDADGLRLSLAGNAVRPRVVALARFEPEHNQIVTVRSASKLERWWPEWRWLS